MKRLPGKEIHMKLFTFGVSQVKNFISNEMVCFCLAAWPIFPLAEKSASPSETSPHNLFLYLKATGVEIWTQAPNSQPSIRLLQ